MEGGQKEDRRRTEGGVGEVDEEKRGEKLKEGKKEELMNEIFVCSSYFMVMQQSVANRQLKVAGTLVRIG